MQNHCGGGRLESRRKKTSDNTKKDQKVSKKRVSIRGWLAVHLPKHDISTLSEQLNQKTRGNDKSQVKEINSSETERENKFSLKNTHKTHCCRSKSTLIPDEGVACDVVDAIELSHCRSHHRQTLRRNTEEKEKINENSIICLIN